MLLVEIRGHALNAAIGDEDYLTSVVFGHLRYVPPSVFWEDFLADQEVSVLRVTSRKCVRSVSRRITRNFQQKSCV